MIVYTSKREKIILADEAFSSGGEGEVRNVISGPSRFKNVCAKLYYEKKRTPEREKKIKYMAANPPSKVEGDSFMIGWPLDWIEDSKNKFLGFIMPLAFAHSKQLIMLTLPNLSKKLDDSWRTRYDRSYGKSSVVSRLKLICNISIPVHLLHSTGRYVLKDFKPENVLITCDGKVTIVDMDSVQITQGKKMLFAGTAATPDYIPQEFYTRGVGKSNTVPLEKSWDHFAIGVVFYKILFGLHPFAVTPLVQTDMSCINIFQNISLSLFPFGENNHKIEKYPPLHDKFKILPKQLQDLFRRAFSEKASLRPEADEWGKCIYALVKSAGEVNPPRKKTTSNKDNQKYLDLYKRGEKLLAVKMYKEETGCTLAEAKHAIEMLWQHFQLKEGLTSQPEPIGTTDSNDCESDSQSPNSDWSIRDSIGCAVQTGGTIIGAALGFVNGGIGLGIVGALFGFFVGSFIVGIIVGIIDD